MLAYAAHVLDDALRLIANGVPLDEVSGRMAALVVRVRPIAAVEAGGAQIVLEQSP